MSTDFDDERGAAAGLAPFRGCKAPPSERPGWDERRAGARATPERSVGNNNNRPCGGDGSWKGPAAADHTMSWLARNPEPSKRIGKRRCDRLSRVAVARCARRRTGQRSCSIVRAGIEYGAIGLSFLAWGLACGRAYQPARRSPATTRVSVDSAGNQGNSHSGFGSISADGRFVAFHSSASNLVSGDANAAQVSSSTIARPARPHLLALTAPGTRGIPSAAIR